MNRNKRNPMEYVWMGSAVLCLIIAVLRTIEIGFSEGLPMFLMTALCVVMYMWRKSLRKKEENHF